MRHTIATYFREHAAALLVLVSLAAALFACVGCGAPIAAGMQLSESSSPELRPSAFFMYDVKTGTVVSWGELHGLVWVRDQGTQFPLYQQAFDAGGVRVHSDELGIDWRGSLPSGDESTRLELPHKIASMFTDAQARAWALDFR